MILKILGVFWIAAVIALAIAHHDTELASPGPLPGSVVQQIPLSPDNTP